MTDTWYYSHNEERVGPFSLAGLRIDLQKISDTKDLLVWRTGFSGWQRADSIREISTFFPMPPPAARTSAVEIPQAPAPEKTGRRIAKVCGYIALMAAVFMIGKFATDISRIASNFMAPSSEGRNTADIEEVFAKTLLKMRTELPKKIDDITTLMWVRYEGTSFIYENRVAIDGAKIDRDMKSKIGQLIFKNVCATAELRRLLNLGATFRYVYADMSAKPVMTIEMMKQNCS